MHIISCIYSFFVYFLTVFFQFVLAKFSVVLQNFGFQCPLITEHARVFSAVATNQCCGNLEGHLHYEDSHREDHAKVFIQIVHLCN